LIAEVVNRKYEFHDLDLSSMVISARHAVSIDEQRESFSPTLWQNFEDLNASLGFAPTDGAAPYQQKWFPGVHGSVGGVDSRTASAEAAGTHHTVTRQNG
jgi:uncharacterized protein (DUF2235 family)